MHLERIDTKLNMSDHLTKGLTRALFHRHADFLLGHIPPTYSHIYQFIIGTYTDKFLTVDDYGPDSFTTPICAKAARTHAPLKSDYAGNPWLMVLWHTHGQYNPYCYAV